jgi:alpha-amylase
LTKKLAFGWVLHQHQPVGNFPWVFDQVYQLCYEPLLTALERHPGVRVTMHYSGPLLDWLLSHHPDYIERLAEMVHRGQVEMLGGGYYEPILPILPPADQQGQISKMRVAIQRHFGTTPEGLWLAERVWEPNLASVLAQAEVRYTILDDTHFFMAGLEPKDLYGYYMTEDQGLPLAVFPNPKTMREVIPFKSLRRIRSDFEQWAATMGDHPNILVMADDGEKFGSWPDTYYRLWEQDFMERFLSFLENNADWLETVPLGEYRRRTAPLGRIYLPSASYTEMMEWALPAERQIAFEQVRHELEAAHRTDILSFLRGGSWRAFAAKYPEANNFQKKMLRVQHHLAQVAGELDPDIRQAAQDHLWQGQCNCGYWHGLFGGVYLADIRSTIYQHLVHAEAIADTVSPAAAPRVTVTDFDCDGADELLLEGPLMNLYLAPQDGGTIFEWDYKPRPFNVVDTMARRPEAYHAKLLQHNVTIAAPKDPFAAPEHPVDLDLEEQAGEEMVTASIHTRVVAKEAGLEKLLHYDPYRRTVLRERFFAPDTSWQAFAATEAPELGDFAGAPYEFRSAGEMAGEPAEGHLVLWRDGTIQTVLGPARLHLRKQITLVPDAAAIDVHYTLRNTGDWRVQTRFGVEGNWGLLGGGHNPFAWYEIDGESPAEDATLDAPGTAQAVRQMALVNSGVGIRVTITLAQPTDLWRFPIETVANSEAGFERSYQCSATLLHWPLNLAPGDEWQVSFRMAISTVE